MWEEVWKDISKVHSGLPKVGRDVYPQEGRKGEQAWNRENEVVIKLGKKKKVKALDMGEIGEGRE